MRNTAGKELFMGKEGYYIDVAAKRKRSEKTRIHSMLHDRSILI